MCTPFFPDTTTPKPDGPISTPFSKYVPTVFPKSIIDLFGEYNLITLNFHELKPYNRV